MAASRERQWLFGQVIEELQTAVASCLDECLGRLHSSDPVKLVASSAKSEAVKGVLIRMGPLVQSELTISLGRPARPIKVRLQDIATNGYLLVQLVDAANHVSRAYTLCLDASATATPQTLGHQVGQISSAVDRAIQSLSARSRQDTVSIGHLKIGIFLRDGSVMTEVNTDPIEGLLNRVPAETILVESQDPNLMSLLTKLVAVHGDLMLMEERVALANA